jgi:GH25 family lysozyme M1 (1,4-beta-N-acetylmuramidase)
MALRQARIAVATLALCAAAVALAPTQASAAPRLTGIDISRFQGAIDWTQVAGSGVQFAFVQASRGSGFDCTVKPDQCGADPYLLANRTNAVAAGVPVGFYHRSSSHRSGPCSPATWSRCSTSRPPSPGSTRRGSRSGSGPG